jgi:hypothetical protein
MLMLNKPILEALVVWFHVGIGPLIGSGPMKVRQGARRTRSDLSESDRTRLALPTNSQAGHCRGANGNVRPHARLGRPRSPSALMLPEDAT